MTIDIAHASFEELVKRFYETDEFAINTSPSQDAFVSAAMYLIRLDSLCLPMQFVFGADSSIGEARGDEFITKLYDWAEFPIEQRCLLASVLLYIASTLKDK